MQNTAENINTVIKEMNDLLSREQAYLNEGGVEKLQSFANEKMQIVANFNRLSQTNSGEFDAYQNRSELHNIKKMLTNNLDRLKFRLDAITEITQTIEGAITDAESDGTYSLS